ncbi:hypothetical protein [Nonomuraea dietziae]|uniref:hypothetical protein n=1 Tax=Nonomuraea dietziae TaxID=65515 RepID=UPI0031D315AD
MGRRLGSGARPLGYVRRRRARLRAAETLHTLAGADATEQIDPGLRQRGAVQRRRLGRGQPVGGRRGAGDSGGLQWTRKSAGAYDAQDDSADLLQAGMRMFRAAGFAAPGFVVVQPRHPQRRTDVVRAFLPRDIVPLEAADRAWVDERTASDRAPREVVHPSDWRRARSAARQRVVRIFPVRYVVRVDPAGRRRRDAGDRRGRSRTSSTGELRRPRGYIRSIFDECAARELVTRRSPRAGFGQYVYDRYATHFNHMSGHVGAHDRTCSGTGRSPPHAASSSERTRDRREDCRGAVQGKGADWVRTTIELHAGVAPGST